MISPRRKVAILLSVLVACADDAPPSPDSEAVAQRVAAFVVLGRVSSIAAEFYYPEQSLREREADRTGVESLLDVIYEDYGAVAAMTRLDAVPPSLFTMVAAGDVKFVNAHPFFTRYPYRVRFSKRGEGYVFVDVMLINRRPVLRSICFALSSERPGAAALIESTGNRMLSVLRSLRK